MRTYCAGLPSDIIQPGREINSRIFFFKLNAQILVFGRTLHYKLYAIDTFELAEELGAGLGGPLLDLGVAGQLLQALQLRRTNHTPRRAQILVLIWPLLWPVCLPLPLPYQH